MKDVCQKPKNNSKQMSTYNLNRGCWAVFEPVQHVVYRYASCGAGVSACATCAAGTYLRPVSAGLKLFKFMDLKYST